LLCELDHKIGRGSLLSWVGRNWPDRVSIVKSILEKGVTPNNLGLTLGVDLMDGVMEKTGRKIIDELLISYIVDFRETILIDLPDYSKQNHSEMIKDLREIQKLWEELLLIEAFDVNIVLFVQKELFKGHFFYGKADVYEIKPLTPEQLYDFYTKNFAGEFIINNQKITYPAPFENEAFYELARLSRGIFRRFKKYIRICLENWYEELEAQGRWKAPLPLIKKDQVLRWIGIEQLEKDMELELMDLFPKSKENRRYSVILLRYLQEHGPTDQKTLTEAIFGNYDDSSKMACSRLLAKLEAHGYIKVKRREAHGSKIWSLT